MGSKPPAVHRRASTTSNMSGPLAVAAPAAQAAPQLCSLPPSVQGLVRGELQLKVDGLQWDLPGAPSNVQARVQWWGEPGEGSVIKMRPSPASRDGHTLKFPIKCGPKPLRKYLKDMGSLVVCIEDSRLNTQKGTVAVDIRMLDTQHPIVGCYPIVGLNRRALGRVEVRVSVGFNSAVVSSFEMNEYLAATDCSLPLYPLPGRPPKEETVDLGPSQEPQIFTDPDVCKQPDLFAIFSRLAVGVSAKKRQDDLQEQFTSACKGSKTLSREGLLRLLQTVMERCKVKQNAHTASKYLVATIEPDSGTEVSLDVFMHVYSETTKLRGLFAAGCDLQVVDALRRLMREVSERRLEVRNAFQKAGARREGASLDVADFVLMLRELFVWISRREEWCLLALLLKQDLSGDGKVTFQGFSALMRDLTRTDAFPAGSRDKENLQAPPGFGWSNVQVGDSQAAIPGHPDGGTVVAKRMDPEDVTLSHGSPLRYSREQLQRGHSSEPLIQTDNPPKPEPVGPMDPLAFLISRAERLKSAMDAAVNGYAAGVGYNSRPYGQQQSVAAELPADESDSFMPLELNEHTLADLLNVSSSPALERERFPLVSIAAGGSPPAISPAQSCGVAAEVDDVLLEELFLQPQSQAEPCDHKTPQQSTLGQSEAAEAVPVVAHQVSADERKDGAVVDEVNQTDSTAEVSQPPAGEMLLHLRLLDGLAGHSKGMEVVSRAKCGDLTSGRLEPGESGPLDLQVNVAANLKDIHLVIEFWEIFEDGDATESRRSLLGLVQIRGASLPWGTGEPSVRALGGVYDVRNILKGSVVGKVEVSVTSGEEKEREPEHERRAAMEMDGPAQHRFSVTVESALGFPSGMEVEMEMGFGPEARYIAYIFPGEEDALYTNEVDAEGEACFGANAKHTLCLGTGESLQGHLVGQDTPGSRHLTFEVWDKWPSGEVSLVGTARLPLESVMGLSSNTTAGGPEVTKEFEIPVEMDRDAPEAGLASSVPLVVVKVGYSRSLLEEDAGNSGGAPVSDSSSEEAPLDRWPAEGPRLPESSPGPSDEPLEAQAAVREASSWMGGGTSVLGRAAQIGPHSYVRMSLFPADQELDLTVPPLRTAFQAQTFTPAYEFRREFPLVMDERAVHAIATQELCLEMWHHSPRTQALRAVLGSKTSDHVAAGKAKDVYLGTACTSLVPLLTRPQGLRSWLTLKSRRGEPVGAVEIAVHFLRIGHSSNMSCHSPLERFPELHPLLPQDFDPTSHMAHGYDGQPARASIHLEEVVLPASEDQRHDRSSSGARSSQYFAMYRLPGSSNTEFTPAMKPMGGGSRGPKLPMNFCGIHWVTAGAALVHAIRGSFLEVDIQRQDELRIPLKAHQQQAPVIIGTAQIDLMPLVSESRGHKGRQGNTRWVMGTCPLIDPSLRDLGGARLRFKVLLELRPAGDEEAQGVRARWDVQGSGFNLEATPRPAVKLARPQGSDEEESDDIAEALCLDTDMDGLVPDEECAGTGSSSVHPPTDESDTEFDKAHKDYRAHADVAAPVAEDSAVLLTEEDGIVDMSTHSDVSFAVDPPSEHPVTANVEMENDKLLQSLVEVTRQPDGLVPVKLCVERCVNLRGTAGGPASSTDAIFCACEWPVTREVVVTPLAGLQRSSETGASADWIHNRLLPLWASKPPRAAGQSPSVAVLKVYMRPGLETQRSPYTMQVEPGDVLLGSAALDFSLLWLGLEAVEGWYNLLDVSQRVVGQLKVSLKPLESLSRRAPLSLPLTEVPGPISFEPHWSDDSVLEDRPTQAKSLHEPDEAATNFTCEGTAKAYMATSPQASDQQLAHDLASRLQELEHLASSLASRFSTALSFEAPPTIGIPAGDTAHQRADRREKSQESNTEPSGSSGDLDSLTGAAGAALLPDSPPDVDSADFTPPEAEVPMETTAPEQPDTSHVNHCHQGSEQTSLLRVDSEIVGVVNAGVRPKMAAMAEPRDIQAAQVDAMPQVQALTQVEVLSDNGGQDLLVIPMDSGSDSGSSSDAGLITIGGQLFTCPTEAAEAEKTAPITLNPTPLREFASPAMTQNHTPKQAEPTFHTNTNWDDWAFGFGSVDVSPSLAPHVPAATRVSQWLESAATNISAAGPQHSEHPLEPVSTATSDLPTPPPSNGAAEGGGSDSADRKSEEDVPSGVSADPSTEAHSARSKRVQKGAVASAAAAAAASFGMSVEEYQDWVFGFAPAPAVSSAPEEATQPGAHAIAPETDTQALASTSAALNVGRPEPLDPVLTAGASSQPSAAAVITEEYISRPDLAALAGDLSADGIQLTFATDMLLPPGKVSFGNTLLPASTDDSPLEYSDATTRPSAAVAEVPHSSSADQRGSLHLEETTAKVTERSAPPEGPRAEPAAAMPGQPPEQQPETLPGVHPAAVSSLPYQRSYPKAPSQPPSMVWVPPTPQRGAATSYRIEGEAVLTPVYAGRHPSRDEDEALAPVSSGRGASGSHWRVSSEVSFTAPPQHHNHWEHHTGRSASVSAVQRPMETGDWRVQRPAAQPPHRPSAAGAPLPRRPGETATSAGILQASGRPRKYVDPETERIARIMSSARQ